MGLQHERFQLYIVGPDRIGNKNKVGFLLLVVQCQVHTVKVIFKNNADECVAEMSLAVICGRNDGMD